MIKGYHHSEETKKKISLANLGHRHPNSLKNLSSVNGFKKGYKPTGEHLKRLSESHIGQIPWNKGKKMPDSFILALKKRKGEKRIWSEERRKRFKERMSGERHPLWIKDRTQIDLNKRRHWSTKCIKWRESVFLRDGYKCKINNKDCCSTIQAHHILNWKDYPELRFDINNGITLCLAHHPRKRAEEKRLALFFKELVSVSKELQL